MSGPLQYRGPDTQANLKLATTSRILVSMRKSHCTYIAFLFSNFLNMSLAFRIYKTIRRPSFHLIEFNKQIVLSSCKFEKKIALFRLAFPCLPRLPLR